MRIAITGSGGQLGAELVRVLRPHHETVALEHRAHDVADVAIVEAIVALRPDCVVHAAAMTDVDGCARDPERAFLVNGFGTRNVAQACLEAGAALCYVSTNEVFDGAQDAPYREWDDPRPINAYGASKLAGERFALTICPRTYVVRTAWLYGPASERNFVRKIIAAADRLGGPVSPSPSPSPIKGEGTDTAVLKGGPQGTGTLRVVADEVGSPTYAPDLAEAIAALIERRAYGVYHLVNAGGASRYEFAQAILRLAGRAHVRIEPIALSDWPRDSTPPPQTRLHNAYAAALGIVLRPWREALAEYLVATATLRAAAP